MHPLRTVLVLAALVSCAAPSAARAQSTAAPERTPEPAAAPASAPTPVVAPAPASAPAAAPEAVAPASPGPARLALRPAAPSLFDRIDPGRTVPAPRLRVALRTGGAGGAAGPAVAPDEQVRVGAQGGRFDLIDGRTGRPVWPERAPGSVLVVPEGGRLAPPVKVFSVQAGAYRDEAAARARAKEMEDRLGERPEIVHDPSRGVRRLRLGAASTAAELEPLALQVRGAGFPDAFITSTSRPASGAANALRVLDARWESMPTGTDRLVVVPRGDARVTVDGRPYRGLLEVLPGPDGGLLVVNEVNFEDYLRGVVPEELGPGVFPELDALKAQAVAARTYAAGNLGQYAADGYDLCDTARCQVYGGVASEHALSDQAVRETAGEILVYDGAPINAMFTSTCGGHTEDVEVVFPEMTGPYLRGVPCRASDESVERRVDVVAGRPVDADDAGGPEGEAAPDTLVLGRLVARGAVPREAFSAAWRARPAGADEIAAWSRAVARLCGLAPAAPFADVAQRLPVWRHLAAQFGPDPGAGPVLPGDEDLVLQIADRDAIPPGDRRALAGLLVRGIVRPGADGRMRPDDVPSRGEVLGALCRAASFFDAPPLREAAFTGAQGGRITLREKGRSAGYTLGTPDLFVEAGGAYARAARLELFPGDRVLFDAGTDDRVDLLALRERKGSSDDRASPKYRWTVVRERETLEKRLADSTPVGTLTDLRVVRRGRSGRIAAIEVKGGAGRAVIEGFRLIRVFDLQESLVGLDVQHNPDGTVRRVVFTGRGWGHGVGLCQYGAYGMALRGVSYRAILAHYYTGATLVRR